MKLSPQACTGFAFHLLAACTMVLLGLPLRGHAATNPLVPQRAAVQPPAARLELLTEVQRASLPNASIVTLISGRMATMGQLRQEHDIRMKRFVNASTLGMQLLQRAPIYKAPNYQGLSKPPLPMQPISGVAKDYTDFCTAAQATACVYFPTGVSNYDYYQPFWATLTPLVVDIDPLITDNKVCDAGGGHHMDNNQGCIYAYPVIVTPNFTAGNFTASATGGCTNGQFSEIYDPHGAVQIKYTGTVPFATTNTVSPGLECIVRVMPN